jgi:hypothetical protein
MEKLKIIFLIPLIFLFFLLCFIPIQAQTTYNWKIDPAIAFKLPAYNTIIKFNNYFYLNSFTWDSYNASMITFNGIQISGDNALSNFGISVKNANATIYYLNTNGIGKIVLSAPSGTESILTIVYPSNYPPRIDFIKPGVVETIYDNKYFRNESSFLSYKGPAVCLLESNKQIKIKAIHSSDVEIDFYWASSPPSSPGVAQSTEITTYIQTPVNIPKVEIYAPEKLINFGLFVIIAIIVGAIISQQVSSKKKVKKWKSRPYSTKRKVESKSWKKKEKEARRGI